MNRRTILAVVGSTLTAGCVGVQRGSQQDVQIESESEIPIKDFPVYGETNAETDQSETLVSEDPQNETLYIAHTVQLPTPGHQVEYTVDKTGANSIEIKYNASYQQDNDTQAQSVIQPTPHAIQLGLSDLDKSHSITIQTIDGNRFEYLIEDKKQTKEYNI